MNSFETSFRIEIVRRWMESIGAKWSEDDVPRLAAATSFFAILSFAPLLVVAVAIAAQFYGSEGQAKEELLHAFRQSAGDQVADLVRTVLDNSHKTSASVTATLISLSVSIWSASNLFMQIHQAIHDIWGMKSEGHFVRRMIKSRLAAIGALLGFGFMLLIWIVLESWIATVTAEGWGIRAAKVASLVAAFLFFTFAFGGIYHSMPSGKTSRQDVIPGAMVASLGLVLSKYVLGAYVPIIRMSTAYGSAGVLVVLLFWIYYLSTVFYFGAEIVNLTTNRARKLHGSA